VRASTMVPAISASLRRHRRAWLVLALGSVALVGGGGAYLRWASWPARATVSGPGYILPLAFSPDGKTLATREVGTVSLRAAADGRARGTWMLYGGSAHVIQAEFTPDGRDLAVLWNDQAGPLTILVDLVDVATGKVRATIDTHLALANLDFLAFADGGRTLRLVLRKPNASGFEVVDCDLGSGRISSSRPLASPAASWPLAVSPDGRFLAVALPMPTPTSRGAVSVWDLEHDREAARLSGGLGGGFRRPRPVSRATGRRSVSGSMTGRSSFGTSRPTASVGRSGVTPPVIRVRCSGSLRTAPRSPRSATSGDRPSRSGASSASWRC